MVLPMLLALTTCPAMLGTQESIRQSQSKNRREEHRARRCNLFVSCVKPSVLGRRLEGRQVVLKNNKLYILAYDQPDDEAEDDSIHPFTGYFLPYPDSSYEGLVSTICREQPILNWIYVDKNTHEVKYGVRANAQDHITGPFDCTQQDRRLNLEEWEGFVAVEEASGIWAVYFDRNDDGLKAKVPLGTRVFEIELNRREIKQPKPEDDRPPQTLDSKMEELKKSNEPAMEHKIVQDTRI